MFNRDTIYQHRGDKSWQYNFIGLTNDGEGLVFQALYGSPEGTKFVTRDLNGRAENSELDMVPAKSKTLRTYVPVLLDPHTGETVMGRPHDTEPDAGLFQSHLVLLDVVRVVWHDRRDAAQREKDAQLKV